MLVRSGFALPTRTTRTADWAEMLREHFVSLDVSDVVEAPRFSGAVRTSQYAHLKVSTVTATEQRIARSDNLIRSDTSAYLQLGMVRRGRAVVRQHGRECVLDAGDFTLYDTTSPFDWCLAGHPDDASWGLEVFTWPRAALSFTDSDIRDLTAVAFDGRAGASGLLARFLHDIVVSRPVADVDGPGQAVVEEVGDLVHAILRGAVGQSTPHSSLYRAAVEWIDDNLADDTLAPPGVAAGVMVSTRQLHRAFAEQGTTVARTIRARRLERCRRDIVSSGNGRSLQEISADWGFRDLAVFSRAFKQEYGLSPRDYRAAVR
ncbi:helix-turn-helix domain-containing protein [Gordonia sp. TBRC 11910]|uniref:Helix-turn-helix domain-containing protein n=1 Tax=Gordonia asplenii TaxID=2725283 RepID=A0A848L1B2_9ACTN|nr:helix-turn-helix domain-containing protein [Gordonia asplenii]NMO02865.1 helix-turn-helix domain-containing protein [Gordonia asplenii]